MNIYENMQAEANFEVMVNRCIGYDANGAPIYGGWKILRASLLRRILAKLGLRGFNISTDTGQDWLAARMSGVDPTGIIKFLALTENGVAPEETDDVLTGEIDDSGLERVEATYAHTPGTNSHTLEYEWTASAPKTVKKAAAFTVIGPPPAGVMVWVSLITDAPLQINDKIKLVVTVSGY